MKKVIFTTFMFAIVATTNAQKLTLLPQFGVENSRTTIQYNDLSSFSPLGCEASPRLALRLDYKFKKGHGPYLGAASSRSGVTFNFNDPETARNSYQASPGKMQLRMEGGYEVSTKPIYLKKPGNLNRADKSSADIEYKSSQKKECGDSYVRSHCGKSSKKEVVAKPKEKGWYMSIKPSAGFAYIPSTEADLTTKSGGNGATYEYKAGNWNTAFITGAGFEFGKNVQRKFVVSMQFLKGIGNLDKTTINTVSNSKTTTTNLKSDAASWSLSIGVPISLNKTKTLKHTEQKSYKSGGRCGQYKSRSRTVI